MVFAGMTDDNKATVQIYLNPLVRWVWIGGIVMFLGSILTMVPNKREMRLVRQETTAAKTTEVKGAEVA
jgi:cytochrome c-type biogenesis protein CcmF